MRSDAKIAKGSLSISALRDAFPLGSAKRVFAIDEEERYIGTVDLDGLHDLKKEHAEGEPAAALAQGADKFLLRYDNVRTALARFDEWQVEALPVLGLARGSPGRRLCHRGAFALRRYNQELERRRSAENGRARTLQHRRTAGLKD